MNSFRFLTIQRKALTNTVLYKLRDQNNRNKCFYIEWVQYPTSQREHDITPYFEFNGNILEFWESLKTYDLRSGYHINTKTPLVYEIYFKRPGYISHTKVYGNHQQLAQFISREWELKIIYSFY